MLSNVDSAALLIGCSLIVVAFLRSGFGEIDVYPSHAVLRTSLTFVLAGAYLFVVGVPCRGGGANWKSRRVPAPGIDGAVGICGIGCRVAVESIEAKDSFSCQPSFQKAAVRFSTDLDARYTFDVERL